MKSFVVFKKEMEEDAPVNVTSNVAGLQGDPPVSKKKQKSYQEKNAISAPKFAIESGESFGGATVFEVDHETFVNIQHQKSKGSRFKSIIKDEECLSSIREYAKKNPSKDIIVKDKNTGSYKFLKKGSTPSF